MPSPYTRKRLTPDERKQSIVLAAYELAKETHLFGFNIKKVSLRLQDCSKSTVKHYFNIDDLRTAVIEHALTHTCGLEIVRQAITSGHQAVAHFTPEERKAIFK